jgi:DNA-binding IclR family transcriptional regulator
MKKNPETTATTGETPLPARERRQRVQAAGTGMAVLKGLARLGGKASLTALAAEVGESPAKVHRYLVSLMEEDIVAQDGTSQHYFLGHEAVLIGLAAMRQCDPVRAAEAVLVRLRESLDVTCFVAVMGNKGPTIIRFEEPGLPVTVNVRVGSVLSLLWSATGRVFLAFQEEPRLRDLAEKELAASPAELRAQLDAREPIAALCREIRHVQCAAVKDTNLKGISAVSAPLYDFTGKVCGALTALGATGGFDASIDGRIAKAIRREAQVVSMQLGAHPEITAGHRPPLF